MNWQARHLAIDDIDAVLALTEEIPEAPHWKRSEYQSCVTQSDSPLLRIGFVVEDQNQLLGFCIGTLVAGICELESVVVAANARRKGVATILLQALVNWAQSRQGVRLELEVRASNHRAIKFYEAAGFVREGIRQDYYRSPDEDAVLMGMALTGGGKNA